VGTRPLPQPDTLTGVIAALPAEARTARPLARCGWRLVTSGMGSTNAQAAAKALLDSGVERLLVWGTAGALQASLQPGTLILASNVVDCEGTHYPASTAWQAQLRACVPAGIRTSSGTLVTVPQPAADLAAKTALTRQTGAVAADMETAAIARFAMANNLPFAVVRAIVDPLAQPVPQAVVQTPPGSHLALRVALRIARRPRDLPAIAALAQNMRAAQRSLAAMASQLAIVPHDEAVG